MSERYPEYEGWTVVREIGAGSFGKVYEIQREDFGYTYKAALKVISVPQSQSEIETARMSEDLTDEKSLQQYFYNAASEIVKEFELMFKLKGNTHIVSYEDHKVIPHEDGIGWDIYIRMELLTPLKTWLDTHTLRRSDVIKLGTDLCEALERCQKFNIIHRDIKPENIFVSEQGDFKLGDFGIARTMERHSFMDMSRKGTVNYMAPEVAVMGNYGFSVDMYSLGLVMYWMLNNHRMPFWPRYPKSVTADDRELANGRRFKGDPLPYPANDHSQLAEIILRASAFKPEHRYSSPVQMREDLEALQYSDEDWGGVVGKGGDTIPRGGTGTSGNRGSGSGETVGIVPDDDSGEKVVNGFVVKNSETNWTGVAVIIGAIVVAFAVLLFVASRLFGSGAVSEGAEEEKIEEKTDVIVQTIEEKGDEIIDVIQESIPTPEPTPDPEHYIEEGDAGCTNEFWQEKIAGEWRIVGKLVHHPDGTDGLSNSYEYDKDGNLIRDTTYGPDGREWKVLENTWTDGKKTDAVLKTVTSRKETTTTYTYSYDEQGREIERSETTETRTAAAGEGEEAVITTVVKWYYVSYIEDGAPENGVGRSYTLSRWEKAVNEDGSYEVQYYDTDDHLVYAEQFDSDDTLRSYYSCEYDFKDRLVLEQKYNADNELMTRVVNTYDDENNSASMIEYDQNGEPAAHYDYTIKKNGNILTHVYSTEGRIIREIESSETGETLSVHDIGDLVLEGVAETDIEDAVEETDRN